MNMTDTDKEQLQMLKDWWKKYGNTVIAAVLVFFISNYGWRYWNKYKNYRVERACIIYTQMLGAVEKKNTSEVTSYAENLIKTYPKSAYASLASFMLAKNAVLVGDYNKAREKLKFIVDKSSSSSLKQIARIRLARVLLQMKEPKQALELLKSVDDLGYKAQIREISGDALKMMGKTAEAKEAYVEAAAATTTQAPLLQLKMRTL